MCFIERETQYFIFFPDVEKQCSGSKTEIWWNVSFHIYAIFKARILKSGLNIVHLHSRNKFDLPDLIFSCFVSPPSYQLKTLNIVKSSNWQMKP